MCKIARNRPKLSENFGLVTTSPAIFGVIDRWRKNSDREPILLGSIAPDPMTKGLQSNLWTILICLDPGKKDSDFLNGFGRVFGFPFIPRVSPAVATCICAAVNRFFSRKDPVHALQCSCPSILAAVQFQLCFQSQASIAFRIFYQ